MQNLSDKIIGKIKKEDVRPVPQWLCLLKKSATWLTIFLLVALGALALALAMYLVQSIDWGEYETLGYSSLHSFLMSAFPYIFIFFLIGCLVLAYFSYRHTPSGHRISFSKLIIIFGIFLLGLGGLLHIFGINQEAYFQLSKVPYSGRMMYTKEHQWLQPEKGLLWGQVNGISEKSVSLSDPSGKDWTVQYDENTARPENMQELSDQDIKVVGVQKSESEFQARSIQLWDGAIRCNGRRNMMMGRHMQRGAGGMQMGGCPKMGQGCNKGLQNVN